MSSKKSKGRAKQRRRLDQRRQQVSRGSASLGASFAAARESDPAVDILDRKPVPDPNEPLEDVAVFSSAARQQLSQDFQAEALAVSEALDYLGTHDFDAASARLSGIARTSPFAPWRLFVRGLVAFYNSDDEMAKSNWSRLEPARRPGRIANTLWSATHSDSLYANQPRPPAVIREKLSEFLSPDGVLKAARAIGGIRHRSAETVFSSSQFAMLKEFRLRFGKYWTGFVEQFSSACMRLSFFQNNIDLMSSMRLKIPGPPHDPMWTMAAALYYAKFQDADGDIKALNQSYREQITRLATLSDDVRQAVLSLLWMRRFEYIEQTSVPARFMPAFFFDGSPSRDRRLLVQICEEAIKFYPRNKHAHQSLIAVLEENNDRSSSHRSKTEKDQEKKLRNAQLAFVMQFPEEVATTVELIDYLLDEGRIDDASKLVQRLQGNRFDDPISRILPWRFKMREAMRLSRRKAAIPQARVALEAAEQLWPSWLSKDWFPFLKAALELRAGESTEFEKHYQTAIADVPTDSPVADLMMLAAMRHMNVPSKDHKSFRDKVDAYAKEAGQLPAPALIAVGAFLWDLTRVRLRHVGYRGHAKKFGDAFVKQLSKDTDVACRLCETEHLFTSAYCWTANHGFWCPTYLDPPAWTRQLQSRHPTIAWATLRYCLDYRKKRYLDYCTPLIEFIQQAAKTEADPYYRDCYSTTANEAIHVLEQPAPSFSSFLDMFANIVGNAINDDDGYDFDDDDYL
ncbi:MAG: hypothetical protein R3E01_20750 [Pirellulaceae bacterium]|nr:hypothetical protein [Planctomycetales bacterium]